MRRFEKGLCVLMAEDTEEDLYFVKRALKEAGLDSCFFAVSDGTETIAYLKGEGEFADRTRFPFPNVVICDIKMPGLDGYGVLRWLREHPECRVVPTIMFSSSAEDSDVHQCYALGANAYLQKPGSYQEMAAVLETLYRFWANCEVPRPPGNGKCA